MLYCILKPTGRVCVFTDRERSTQMEDSAIIDLYWAREERALSETDTKYGGYCRSIAHNILKNRHGRCSRSLEREYSATQ